MEPRLRQRADRRRRRRRPRAGPGPLAVLGLGLTALVGTASALISRRPAPSAVGGAAGHQQLPLPLARALQAGRRHLPAAAAGARGPWMTALQPERPKGQQVKESEQQAAGSAWYQPRLLAEAEELAAQPPPRTTLQRPAMSQPLIDLQDPHVEVSIRPATAEEIPLVVDLRHDVFSAACAIDKDEDARAVAEWKARSLANLRNRRAKGAVLLVATARDRRWGPEAAPLLVGSLEYSHHEFRETGFSPILAGDLYCEEDGDDEELEHCYIFDDDVDAEEREWSSWGDACSSSRAFRRPASRRSTSNADTTGGSGGSSNGGLGDKLYVTGVMVANCARRQGLGLTLLRAVESHAQRLRTPYICMFVEPGNAAALGLYTRKAGYNLVPYSPTAEAFAAAIGLYKGPYAAKSYAFVYTRLELLPEAPPSPPQEEQAGEGEMTSLADAQAAARPFPARMPALGSSFFS